MLKWISSILLVFILIFISDAQVRKLRVNSIVIEGNKEAQASSIRLNSGLLVGNEIAGEDLQQAVKNLWALGIFSDIQIFIDNQTATGIDLLIKVQEYPRLNDIVITGNDEFDSDEIEDDLTTYKRMIVSDYRLFKIKQTIKMKYLEEGYLLAEINIDTSFVSPSIININVNINEGEEVQIEGITIHGNEKI